MGNKIIVDTSQINRIAKDLEKLRKEIPGAAVSAINRTLNHVFSKTGQIVTKHYNVASREIKNSMEKHNASFSRPSAFIRIRSRRYTIARFLPGGLGSSTKVAKVKIKKSAGYKRIGGRPTPFPQKTKGGNTHVFRRKGKNRYPIDILRTLSPTQMVENLDVTKEIQEAANDMLAKRIEHEIKYRLSKVGK